MPRCARSTLYSRRLQQLQDDVFHILAHITGFGQRGRIGHGEGHVQNARQRLRQQGLAAAGGADQQDVGLRQFDIGLRGMVQPLVVVVHRHRQHALGVDLADHIIVQHLADSRGVGTPSVDFRPGGLRLFADDVHAQLDAFVADEHRRPRDQLAHLMLALAAERAIKRVLAVAAGVVRHLYPLPSARLGLGKFRPRPARFTMSKLPRQPSVAACGARLTSTCRPSCRGFRGSRRSGPRPWHPRPT